MVNRWKAVAVMLFTPLFYNKCKILFDGNNTLSHSLSHYYTHTRTHSHLFYVKYLSGTRPVTHILSLSHTHTLTLSFYCISPFSWLVFTHSKFHLFRSFLSLSLTLSLFLSLSLADVFLWGIFLPYVVVVVVQAMNGVCLACLFGGGGTPDID